MHRIVFKVVEMCIRDSFIKKHYPDVLTVSPEECFDFVQTNTEHGGADVVLEVAGAESTFRLAWECARPNAIVTIVEMCIRDSIIVHFYQVSAVTTKQCS